MFVATIAPGSPAAREGALTIGDRLLAVSISHETEQVHFIEGPDSEFYCRLGPPCGRNEHYREDYHSSIWLIYCPIM